MDLTEIYIGYLMLYAKTKNPEHIKMAKIVREMRNSAENSVQTDETKQKDEELSI